MTHTPVPPLAGPIGFNAQHAPVGAFMSFTCGHVGTRGGIGVEIGQPAAQNLFIGVKEGNRFSRATLRCLPFFEGAGNGAARPVQGAEVYLVEQAGPAEQHVTPDVVPFAESDITRHYGWATDTWRTRHLAVTIHTPFGEIPDPESADHDALRAAISPSVTAELVIDNRDGHETKTGVFALQFAKAGLRLMRIGSSATGQPLWAFVQRDRIGFAADLDGGGEGELFPFQRWDPAAGLREVNPVHQLGQCAGFGVEVPAGQMRRVRIAIGCYLPGTVTTGIEGRYLYTRYYSSLAHVLCNALEPLRFEAHVARAQHLDAQLLASGLSAEQQFLIAHATRSYYGSTQLLDVAGEPFWVVNEGEYCMMNTLDLSVDQAFWELERHPWVVRNLLDNFVRHYSFVDQVKVYSDELAQTNGHATHSPSKHDDPSQLPPPPDERQLNRAFSVAPGGLSFTHDMGAHNNFSPRGTSSYELPELTGCFSHMTQEQLCNWVLLAGCYVTKTKDVAWAQANRHVLTACLESMNRRRGDKPGDWMCRDSTRCGRGQEITTYDSLDESLGQARSNLYVAVKRWASYAALRTIAQIAGFKDSLAEQAGAEMIAFARHLAEVAEQHGTVLPAVLESSNPGYASRILSACEPLIYPWYWSTQGHAFDTGIPETQSVVDVLAAHTRALLTDSHRRNLFPDGGLRLSSTSNNSWMSKIAIVQQVIRRVLRLTDDPRIDALLCQADVAHVRWQRQGSAYWACSDQIVSGEARASRYYPRVITTALWLGEREAPRTGTDAPTDDFSALTPAAT